ncbi:MAG TPA: hypothetical protein ENI87_05900 [bacterium]|nr:hypothetical protein [bacterium]
MNFFKNMDLYKAIVLLSAVLLPLGGWWISKIDEEIKQCEAAVRTATRKGGYLEEIGKLQKKIETIAQNRRVTGDSIQDSSTYFEAQILEVNPNLRSDDFKVPPQKPDNVTVGRQKLTDWVVDIDWGKSRDLKKVTMDFVFAVLFNCESGARGSRATSVSPSVWRLRKLSLVNAAAAQTRGRDKTPAPEMQDEWLIKDMQFARRTPRMN